MFELGEQETLRKNPRIWILLLAFLAMQAAGCITIKRRTEVKKEEIRPQLESSEENLLASYNNQVRAVQSLQATVDLIPSTGTTYSGVIEEYHDVPGFILAQRPATVRVIGQAPVVAKNIFDMVSDGKEFRIYIPSKNSFLVGPTALIRASKKPLENLRPQHIVEALFWPEFSANANVLFEQFDFSVSRYYILTLLRPAKGGKFEIARKVWYSRTDLKVSRVQLFGAGGKLDSDIQYSDWELAPPAEGAPAKEQVSFARDIHIWRPQDDYKLEIKILKLTLNEPISPDKFELAQPEGTDLVRVSDDPFGSAIGVPTGVTTMIRQLVVNNVLHRPIRTIVSVIAVGVEVALVILIVGLTSGLLQETAKRIEGIGADIMLQPPSASVFLAFSGAPMPIKIADKLRELRYVQAVAPVLLQFSSSGGVDIIYGIDPKSFRDVSGGFVFLEGHDMQGPDDILLDDWAAKAKHVTVDSTFRLLDHDFHVAGIVEHGKGARLFVPLATLQDLSGSRDKASIFFIKCTRADHTQAVMDEMRPVFPGYEIRPLKDFLSLMTASNLPGLDAFIESMIALAVSIGFLVILLSMYTTVIERTRDIGVLKSIGASKGYIIRALLGESALICVIGIGVGIAMSYTGRAVFLSSFPTLSILITPDWIVRSALIAFAGGLLGASYPAWLASRKDAIEALSYD